MADPAPVVINANQQSSGPDPEVAAIVKVNDALASLEPEMQQRVLRWAADRFNVKLKQANVPAQPRPGTKEEQTEDREAAEPQAEFDDFASLYDAANPTTEADKALVAGYWLQVIRGNSDWGGFSANQELRNLGHGIVNITIALSQLIESSPRLVMQTHKSGKTKQARKKYKLTVEGTKRAKQMLGGAATEGENGGQG
jgi:hypothetical protein